MPSASLRAWATVRASKLDELEAAHAAVGGLSRGRRWATEQINHAYVVLLCSQFQGFCRDLHTECADSVVRACVATRVQDTVQLAFTRDRRLDRGNPTAEAISADFGRLGVDLWRAVNSIDRRNLRRKGRLDEMLAWRNAIAHQDFSSRALVPAVADLTTIRVWRRACSALARATDGAMERHLRGVLEEDPW